MKRYEKFLLKFKHFVMASDDQFFYWRREKAQVYLKI